MKSLSLFRILVVVLTVGWIAAELRAEGVKFESGIGAGAVISGNENVGTSGAVEAEALFQIGDYLGLGLQVGQAFHFNQKDRSVRVKDAEANPQNYASKSYHPQPDGDVIVVDNDNTDITVNIINTPDPLPKRPRNVNEMDYTSFEPELRLGYPIGLGLRGTPFFWQLLYPYIKGFYGGARIRTQDGVVDIGSSYGYGAGVRFGLAEGLNLVLEYKHRKIEVYRDGYDHDIYAVKIGRIF